MFKLNPVKAIEPEGLNCLFGDLWMLPLFEAARVILLRDIMWSSGLPFKLEETRYKYSSFGWLQLPSLYPSPPFT
jgi:hypothetical protein